MELTVYNLLSIIYKHKLTTVTKKEVKRCVLSLSVKFESLRRFYKEFYDIKLLKYNNTDPVDVSYDRLKNLYIQLTNDDTLKNVEKNSEISVVIIHNVNKVFIYITSDDDQVIFRNYTTYLQNILSGSDMVTCTYPNSTLFIDSIKSYETWKIHTLNPGYICVHNSSIIDNMSIIIIDYLYDIQADFIYTRNYQLIYVKLAQDKGYNIIVGAIADIIHFFSQNNTNFKISKHIYSETEGNILSKLIHRILTDKEYSCTISIDNNIVYITVELKNSYTDYALYTKLNSHIQTEVDNKRVFLLYRGNKKYPYKIAKLVEIPHETIKHRKYVEEHDVYIYCVNFEDYEKVQSRYNELLDLYENNRLDYHIVNYGSYEFKNELDKYCSKYDASIVICNTDENIYMIKTNRNYLTLYNGALFNDNYHIITVQRSINEFIIEENTNTFLKSVIYKTSGMDEALDLIAKINIYHPDTYASIDSNNNVVYYQYPETHKESKDMIVKMNIHNRSITIIKHGDCSEAYYTFVKNLLTNIYKSANIYITNYNHNKLDKYLIYIEGAGRATIRRLYEKMNQELDDIKKRIMNSGLGDEVEIFTNEELKNLSSEELLTIIKHNNYYYKLDHLIKYINMNKEADNQGKYIFVDPIRNKLSDEEVTRLTKLKKVPNVWVDSPKSILGESIDE